MNFSRIIFSLILVAVSTSLIAQCSSNKDHKTAKVVQASMSLEKDIIDLAVGTETLSTLVAAVKAADLVAVLKSDGPFTVFAPVNSAFDKLPEGTLKSLLQPENKETLSKILTYHVVSGEFKAADVVNAIKAADGVFTINTVSGNILKASLSKDSVILTDENGGIATITATDIDASNGVVHIIDSVVLPK
jgi:uncharacterized surface protein with fasciclin (FAS1) repeats